MACRRQSVRGLIDQAWRLHEEQGTDGGVRLGLSLIGVFPDIVQWWQTEPEGHHDTHEITAYVNDHIFDDEAAVLNAKVQMAVLRMIDATKRWSQDTYFKIGVGLNADIGAAGALQIAGLKRAPIAVKAPMPGAAAGAGRRLSGGIANRAVHRHADCPSGGQIRRRRCVAGGSATFINPYRWWRHENP